MEPSQGRRFCCDEDVERLEYEGHDAERELQEWRRRGPRPTTRELIDAIRAEGVDGAALLDIGAGVGVVHIALLNAGVASAVDVDASREYIAVARAEADRQGLAGRVEYRYGDVVELAGELPPADIVTLDSVICCYPSLPALLHAATRPGPRLVGLVYPDAESRWMRASMSVFNIVTRLRRLPSRYFVHRRVEIDRLMGEAGFVESYRGGTSTWRVIVYRRAAAQGVARSRMADA